MTEYIKRNYLRKMAMFETAYTMETETDAAIVLRMIDDAPTADVAPVVHGQWILEREPNGKPYCFLFLVLIVVFGTMAIGIYYTRKKPTEIQKVLIEDSVRFNDFMDYYDIKSQEGDLWIVVPKE